MGRTAAPSAPSQASGTLHVLNPLPFAQGIMPQLQVQVPNQPPPQPRRYPEIETKAITLDQIYQYFYPWNPFGYRITVIGVAVRGTSTSSKRFLPDVYQAACVPMLCHSCYAPLSRDAVFIGDHQPPTSLYRLLCDPRSLNTGIIGRPGYIARYIASHQIPFPLYLFSWGHHKFQTNNYCLAQALGGRTPKQVYYGDPTIGQYLYPHCWRCSARQGDILR